MICCQHEYIIVAEDEYDNDDMVIDYNCIHCDEITEKIIPKEVYFEVA